MHTAPGSFFTSVALESANAGVLLCIETGAMCEAHKYNERVTHCLCVVREDENTPFTVLSPCGVCQERLRYWGEDVRVGVTTAACALCRCIRPWPLDLCWSGRSIRLPSLRSAL